MKPYSLNFDVFTTSWRCHVNGIHKIHSQYFNRQKALICIEPEHLPEEIRTSGKPGNSMVISLGTPLEDIEREVIRRTLVEVTHHREQAAKLLGISVRALQYKIKEYGIEV